MRSKAEGSITEYMERLRLSAIRKNKKAKKLVRKIDKEMTKDKVNLPRVLVWQRKVAKLTTQALTKMKRREKKKRTELRNINLKRSSELDTNSVNFILEKVSERFVKKYSSTSCVYRVRLEDETSLESTKVKDILNELGAFFDNVVDSVKEQCNLDHPNDDKMRVMISSTALKTPISTKLLPSRQITSPRILTEIGKVLQSNDVLTSRSFFYDRCGLNTCTPRFW